jgi:hypothetical protein
MGLAVVGKLLNTYFSSLASDLIPRERSEDEEEAEAEEEEEAEDELCPEEVWGDRGVVAEMRQMFVFCSMGGMTRALLRSSWAAALNTTDHEKERILNRTFVYFEADPRTQAMLACIAPSVQADGLRSAMQRLNQRFPVLEEGGEVNDTDSEKQRRDQEEAEEEDQEEDEGEMEEDDEEEVVAPVSAPRGPVGARSRMLSTDTIKDETLWEAETALEQLWGEGEDRAVRRPPQARRRGRREEGESASRRGRGEEGEGEVMARRPRERREEEEGDATSRKEEREARLEAAERKVGQGVCEM